MSRVLAIVVMLAGLMAATSAFARADVCAEVEPRWQEAADANAASFYWMEWAPFSGPEVGWETYLPLIQREIGTACGHETTRFAAALASWQARYSLAGTGVFDPASFQVLRGVMQERRPFVMARINGECPDSAPLLLLAYIPVEHEQAERMTRLLRRDVLQAYLSMVEAARSEVPEIAADPELLKIFSGWRDPDEDRLRCEREGNCDGLRRAVCSSHRTGTAIDIYVGHATGWGVDSTDHYNRLQQSRGAAYRWLVANAHRFGFVNYIYEPWHWEWIGPPAVLAHDLP